MGDWDELEEKLQDRFQRKDEHEGMPGNERAKHFLHSLLPVTVFMGLQLWAAVVAGQLYVVYCALQYGGREIGSLSDFLGRLQTDLHETGFLLMVLLVESVANFLFFLVWYGRRRKDLGHAGSGTRGYARGRLAFGLILLVVSGQVAFHYVAEAAGRLFPMELARMVYSQKQLGLSMDEPVLLSLLAVFFLGPVAEELVFRGLTFGFARRGLSFAGANVVQALLFAGAHMNMVQASYAFFMGLVFGLVMERSKNILLPIMLHVGFNALGGVTPLLVAAVPDSPAGTYLACCSSMMLVYIATNLILDAIPEPSQEGEGAGAGL